MNTAERAAAQSALEALEHIQRVNSNPAPTKFTFDGALIDNLRAVLAQPTAVMLAPSDKLIWHMIENAQRISGVQETVAINYAMKELSDKVIASMSLGVATEPVAPDESGCTACAMCGQPAQPTQPQGEPMPETISAFADAQLIAAAPDLLEALQAVVRVADRATVEFDLARAAIARATGGGK
jgi:hypothetical protein